MKLINAKIVKGSFAATRMEWFCGEFEEPDWMGGNASQYIGCIDYTVADHAKPIFFISKGQPPETFDFQKDAYFSYEQIAMAQLTVMEWDKLKNGDKITLDDEMEDKIREWGGRIWMGGSSTTIRHPAPGVNILVREEQPLEDRLLDGRIIRYSKKNEEY